LPVALRAGAVLAGGVDRCKQTCPNPMCRADLRVGPDNRAALQRIARARFDQRLEDALIGQPQVEQLAERMQRRDPAAERRSRLEDRVDGPFAEPLDRREPEPDAAPGLHREVELALVDVGW